MPRMVLVQDDAAQEFRWRDYLKAEWPQPLASVATAVGLASSAAEGRTMAILIFVSIAMGSPAALRQVTRKSAVMKMQREIARLKRQAAQVEELERELTSARGLTTELLWALLNIVRKELRMGPNERVTVYIYLDAAGAFQRLQRSAENPSWQAGGRTAYADGVGVIGTAWSGSGEVVEVDLPEWGADGRDYIAENMRRFRLPSDVCVNLSMKSRSLIGVRFPSGEGGARPLGVLILESTRPDWANAERLEELKSLRSWAVLQDYLQAHRNSLPRLSEAAQRGY